MDELGRSPFEGDFEYRAYAAAGVFRRTEGAEATTQRLHPLTFRWMPVHRDLARSVSIDGSRITRANAVRLSHYWHHQTNGTLVRYVPKILALVKRFH